MTSLYIKLGEPDDQPTELDQAWADYDTAMLLLSSMYHPRGGGPSADVRRAQAEEAAEAWQIFRTLYAVLEPDNDPQAAA